MATLILSYLGGASKGVAYDIIGSESVTTSGTSAQSAAIPDQAEIVHVYCVDTGHYVKIGSNPTAAAATGFYVPAATVREFKLKTGMGISTYKLAAITG